MHVTRGAAAAIVAAGLATPAYAAGVAIYTNIQSSDTSLVPGLGGVRFDPGTGTTDFDRIFLSPTTGWWAITAFADLDIGEDELLIVGQGTTGTLQVQEGTPVPFNPSENYGLLGTRVAINDAGDFAFATNTDGPTDRDEYIITSIGGTFAPGAQEGASVPGVPGADYGSTLDTAGLTNSGNLSFTADSVAGVPSDQNEFLFTQGGAAFFAQEGVTVPNGVSNAWQNFDSLDYWVANDGTTYLAQGDTDGPTGEDDILVYNNDVVVQEGATLSGFASPVSTIAGNYMNIASGDWLARGSNDDGKDWVLMNGSVVAESGDAVPGGLPGETFSDAPFAPTFFAHTSNSLGDYIVAGTTSNPDEFADAVLVFNSQLVIARQGDPVDLDGNGLFDDNVFIDTFGNDDIVLTDDLQVYAVVTLMDDTFTRVGQGLIVFPVPSPGAAALLGVAALAGARRRR